MNALDARLSRLPLRLRLVAGFSAAMFVVLLCAGAFVYWRVQFALDRGLDSELVRGAAVLAPLVTNHGQVSDRDAARATGLTWQVLDASGGVLDGSVPTSTALVSTRVLDQVGASPRVVDVGDFLPASPAPQRLRVTRIGADPPTYLAVGVRRDHRDEALRELLAQLTVAGLGALVVTAFVGERLARAALRPVERYRRKAAAIAAGSEGVRLDVPPLRDDEVTRLGHTLNDMLGTLERALDRERHFVNEASHELRTPITLLSGRLQLARRRARSAQEYEQVLAELDVDLDRLARLADQLLALGAISDGRAVQSDLVALTARLIEERRVADPAVAGSITAQLPGAPVMVAVSDFDAERIVTNLLDNAALHGRPPVQVAVDRQSDWARLAVSDAGPGMPPDLLETATQRFSRSSEARSLPGAGLGLALVLALVDRAGGELRLCHDGRHTFHGRRTPVECTHDPRMTVTVLLPVPTGDQTGPAPPDRGSATVKQAPAPGAGS